ncbi:MAG: preprotein translocase subunit SecY [Phycisphaerales bacterium]|nr:MAG: preprotein translocase subunit SecY [Phycisphaerales bacterium]
MLQPVLNFLGLASVVNVFKVPELRTKILFTLAMLAVYRIGFWIPLPGVDQALLIQHFQDAGETAFGRVASYVAVFSGGSFGQSTIFGLGIMPYITAAIIMQLVGSVSQTIKKLREEGPTGQAKIQDWTRRLTVGLCLIQAIMWLSYINQAGLVEPQWRGNTVWYLMGVTAMTAGTVFLMWIGEQIDRFGIGNGASMIIMAGILAEMPGAIGWVIGNFEPGVDGKLDFMSLILLLGGFVLVCGGAVLITVAQRRIPVQQAKHTRGRKVVGGQRSYLPLRVNHGGVMPIIFASSLMLFPSVIFSAINENVQRIGTGGFWPLLTQWMSDNFQMGEFMYVMFYIVLVYFFSYFWITVQFNPEEMSKQLRDHGSFIPGLRPGPRTAEYLETVMERITFVGAAALAVIAVLPMIVNRSLNIDFRVAQFLGGTGLLIVVAVSLDFLQRVEANLMMRNYAGFLGGQDDGKAKRIRGPRG